jgi:hypothetical protein
MYIGRIGLPQAYADAAPAYMHYAGVIQALSLVLHLVLGSIYFLEVLGVDVFGQGAARSNGYRWIIFYVVALVWDIIETACVLSKTRAQNNDWAYRMYGYVIHHWVNDALVGILLLNYFVSRAPSPLQWTAVVVIGFLLNFILEWRQFASAVRSSGDSTELAGTSKTGTRWRG